MEGSYRDWWYDPIPTCWESNASNSRGLIAEQIETRSTIMTASSSLITRSIAIVDQRRNRVAVVSMKRRKTRLAFHLWREEEENEGKAARVAGRKGRARKKNWLAIELSINRRTGTVSSARDNERRSRLTHSRRRTILKRENIFRLC